MDYYTKLIYKLALFLVALLAFWSGLVYRLYQLNTLGIIVSVFMAFLSLTIILYLARKYNFLAKRKSRLATLFSVNDPVPIKRSQLILVVLYLFLFLVQLRLLISSAAVSAIVSPWQATPAGFFIIFFLATAVLLYLALSGFRYTTVLIALHFGLMISVAHFVFVLGFGFDPFIHEATLNKISQDGQILPKPLYYLGQYGLIIILHKLFFIPIAFLNKLLVPILAIIFLPYAVKNAIKKWTRDERLINLTVIIFLILPLGIFTVSTPQNLAYLLLILIILLSITCKNWLDLALVYALALATMIIHPIAGIPAILWSALLTVRHSDIKHFKGSYYRVILAVAIAALPLAFYYINSSTVELSALSEGLSLRDLSLFSISTNFFPNSESIVLNLIYFYIFNIKILILSIVLAGLFISWRYREKLKNFGLFLAMALAMLGSYILTSLLPFNFLINYERSSFADRILIVTLLFLLPFILAAFFTLSQKLLATGKHIKSIFLIFLALLITLSLYFSYPRYDNYHNSHSYSLSQSDINAVTWVEENATGDYIVLANQQVSAAALNKFGFKKYFDSKIENRKSKIFYYPIPTGSPLYQYYLDMVYDSPSRETMASAMDLVGVDEAYFIINKYWWAFDKVVAEAKLTADSFQIIDNGEIYIFKYIK